MYLPADGSPADDPKLRSALDEVANQGYLIFDTTNTIVGKTRAFNPKAGSSTIKARRMFQD